MKARLEENKAVVRRSPRTAIVASLLGLPLIVLSLGVTVIAWQPNAPTELAPINVGFFRFGGPVLLIMAVGYLALWVWKPCLFGVHLDRPARTVKTFYQAIGQTPRDERMAFDCLAPEAGSQFGSPAELGTYWKQVLEQFSYCEADSITVSSETTDHASVQFRLVLTEDTPWKEVLGSVLSGYERTVKKEVWQSALLRRIQGGWRLTSGRLG